MMFKIDGEKFEKDVEILVATGNLLRREAESALKQGNAFIYELEEMKKKPEMYFQELFCANPLDEDECAELKEVFAKILAKEDVADIYYATVDGVDYVVQLAH